MKQVQSILSTYTADVSGVCSALFELGGMVVMHDASGCNSTYNTHDEPRWYDMDSLVFISGLSEMEAIMGDDEKLLCDIVEAVQQLKPRFVAIAGTPIPMMVGCDLPAIAAQVEAQCGIPAFGFDTNGMHSYVPGAGMALAAYARRMTDPGVRRAANPTVNLLGATPLDFSVNGSIEAMKEVLEQNGWTLCSTWAMGSTPEKLNQAGCAWVNLVVSSVGLPAAEVLRETFGTPYIIGTPTGKKFNARLLSALKEAVSGETITLPLQSQRSTVAEDCFVIGESVTAKSLAVAIGLEYGKTFRTICPLETFPGILSDWDLATEEESNLRQALRQARCVIADPMYKPILPPECQFYPLAHEAYSGRIWRASIPNVVERI